MSMIHLLVKIVGMKSFDVIFANPPFMSPAGGVHPHNRFSVRCLRSEVLFVDYILEHLNTSGRAGIIIPEVILFKSDKAHKQLRKKLIEEGLFAVVSLPRGVFQPYTGVQTSILFIDSQFASQRDSVLFLKIDNDGFDLGARRRKIDKNDLPTAINILKEWKQEKKKRNTLAFWVQKKKIANNDDFNLTDDRYKINRKNKNTKILNGGTN